LIHGGDQHAGSGAAVGVAALAAAQPDAEVTQGLGRIGFGEGDPAGGQQRAKRSVERPQAKAAVFVQSGQDEVLPGGDRGFARLVGSQGPEQRRAGRSFRCGSVALDHRV
jgi:hypothetical protein